MTKTIWHYGPTIGRGIIAEPTYPHPTSTVGRQLIRRGIGIQLQLDLPYPRDAKLGVTL